MTEYQGWFVVVFLGVIAICAFYYTAFGGPS